MDNEWPKYFSLGQVLSIVTPILCVQDIGELYEILNAMSGDNLATHQLGRVADEVAPYLLDQYPQLALIDADRLAGSDKIWQELKRLQSIYGDYLLIYPMHREDHDQIDPIDELRRLRPDATIITFNEQSDEPPISDIGDIAWKI